MFKSIALFALLNAALVSSIALTPRAPAIAHNGLSSDAADAILVFTTCNRVNLQNCVTWTATTLPVGCTSLIPYGQGNAVQSATTPSGIACTLYNGQSCNGLSQLINGTVNDLSTVGFSRLANSYNCRSN
ncbi:hypothetical protein GGU10DRAFT_363890 [Lentinula aff. detonsa]|uniref:Immunomodulatory protein n=1 Tax=Lentinula aff. detonsa TaxID=2804958 RepID=A0AA38KM10_9AGAR|nr:hypothetical protein GGU10DRAFT_363890 [Lentinula aff. detonsa]